MKKSKVVLQTKRRKQKRRLKRMFFVPLLCVTMLLVGALLALILPYFRVSKIEVSGTQMIKNSEIEHLADTKLAERRFVVSHKSNYFLLPLADVKAAILEAFPRIEDVDVVSKFPNTLRISLKERSEWGIWCSNSASGTCYHLNEEGILLDSIETLPPDIPPFVDERSHLPKPGQPILDKEFFSTIRDFIIGLARTDITATRILLGHDGDNVWVITEDGWHMILDDKTNGTVALENLEAMLAKEIKNPSTLEYMDLRFEDKVFYKKK